MKKIFCGLLALMFLTVLQLNFQQSSQACGPSYLQPVFDYTDAPERPWTDFASGKLGIVKPTYRRSVLFAAYRYLNGPGLSQYEQKAVIDTWESQFNRKDPQQDDVTAAVKEWVKARKSVAGDEAKVPEIYTERQYAEDYSFFPNCSKNAFEVAMKTLEDRAGSYGSDSKEVKEWLSGQDKVFEVCAGGTGSLTDLGPEYPDWLRKDRDYQMAAAAFYSTNYKDARERFEKIAADGDSPWHELADYLVARTLVRQSSVGIDDKNPEKYYKDAEEYLNNLVGRSSAYNGDAQRMLNLIKFRTHPEQRVRELAQKLPVQGNSDELSQDLIDYTWLLDQFESEALQKIDDRKAREAAANSEGANANLMEKEAINANKIASPSEWEVKYDKQQKGETLQIYVYKTVPVPGATPDPNEAATDLSYDVGLTDEEIAKRAEETIGRKLTAAEITSIAAARTESFNHKLQYYTKSEYKGNYYGPEKLSLGILPDFLGADPLSEWIFTYQAQSDDAYFLSLDRWKQTSSELWLMTAMTKAKKGLAGVKELMEAAKSVPPASAAYFTITYHRARVLIEQGNKDEARKLLDTVLADPERMPVSTRNLFTAQRLNVSQTLTEFLQFSLRKPFGFSYDDSDDTASSIDDIIAEQKSWWNPEYSDVSQAQNDLDVEKEFAEKKLWQDRSFFDDKAVDIINENFPTAQMIELLNNEKMPDYLSRRLTIAIWTRAYLLKDEKTALGMAPAVVKIKPEIAALMAAYTAAATPAERDKAGLFMILKDGEFSPYLSAGFDYERSVDFDIFDDSRWWCEQYDVGYDDEGNEVPKVTFKPPFLTPEMLAAAKTQKAGLNKTKDAVSFLSHRVMDWAQTGVPDKRLPESLYIIFQSNQWIKYGCGDYSDETRAKALNYLKTRYPKSKWTAQAYADMKEADQ